MKSKFFNALSLALIAAMLVTSIALADIVTSDVVLATSGNQTFIDLGDVAPGQIITSATSFQLVCNGNNHADQGNTVSVQFFSVSPSGNLTATNATIGPIPTGWADDATGPDNCASGTVSSLDDNGNSTVTITAPNLAGTYDYVVTYKVATSGGIESNDVTGSIPAVTFRVTVVTPPSDTTPPVITKTISGTLGNNGWYTSDVTIDWTVTDPESSFTMVGCVDTTINSDTSGITSSCSATSAGGTSSDSVAIKRDATAPTISASPSPAANANGWNNTDVTVSYSCTDNGPSGVDTAASILSDDLLTASGSASGTCVDLAGNSANASYTAQIDKVKPVISGSRTPAANANGWNNTDVVVSFSCTDSGGSGIDTNTVAGATVTAEGAGQSVTNTGACTDKAGNTADFATLSGIHIDKTTPSVSLVGGPANGGTYYFGFVPAAPTCSASDTLSGLDGSCSVSGYSNAIGTHTVSTSATDKAGNSANASATYTVSAWTLNGFYQPVDMNNVINIVRGGSTVPLKFEIFAGPTELTSTSAVQSFVQTRITCDTSATIDEIEVTTTGGTSLRYDTTSGQFIQNWQTPRQAGACYRVTMTTQDGSSLVAFFKLK